MNIDRLNNLEKRLENCIKTTDSTNINELENIRDVLDLRLSLNKIESNKIKKQRKKINNQIQNIMNNKFQNIMNNKFIIIGV